MEPDSRSVCLSREIMSNNICIRSSTRVNPVIFFHCRGG